MRRRHFILALVVLLIPANTFALTAVQKKAASYDAPYYNASSSCIGGAAGTGPLFGLHFPKITDTTDLANRINDFISKQPGSPWNGLGATFVSDGQKYDVNPAYVVGDGNFETGMGTTGGQTNHNYFGIGGAGHFQTFPTVEAGLDNYFQQIGKSLGPPQSILTIAEETGLTVNGDKTQPNQAKVTAVNDAMQKILGGIAVDVNSPAVAPISSCGAITTSAGALGWDINGEHAMVTYLQADPKWGSDPYGAGKNSIAESGCGPTSIAMVLATLLGRSDITPLSIANQYGAQYHTDGTAWGIFAAVAKDYNVNIKQMTPDFNQAAATLKAGGFVIASFGKGYFTTVGHFMVIRAVSPDGTQFYIADPANAKHNDVAYSIQFLQGQGNITEMWTVTK